MIVNLTISLFLKTRRFKAWTIDELKSLKGIKEASSDAAKGSLMSAFRLSTAIDARILNIPRVMGYIADADSRVRATIQQQSTAHHGTCQPSSDVESTATIAPNEVYIFTGDYINPTSWSAWDEHNPQCRLIDGLKDLRQRKSPLAILDECGTLAAVEVISINLFLLPALCEGDDVSLAELVLAEWSQVIEENQSVFSELQADIAHSQWTRRRNLRYFPIPESLDEGLEGKYRLDDDEESLPDLSDFLASSSSPPSPTSFTFPTCPNFTSSFDSPLSSPTSFSFSSFTIPHLSSMTPTPTPIVTSFGNIPGIPRRWSDFDEEDDSLPDISDFIATEDRPASEDEEEEARGGNESEAAAATATATAAEPKALLIPGSEEDMSKSGSTSTTSSPLREITEITVSHGEDVSFSSFASDVSSEPTSKFGGFGLSLTFGMGTDEFSDCSRLSLISSPSPITPMTPMTPATIRGDGLHTDSSFPFPFPLSSSSQECCVSGQWCHPSHSSHPSHSCCAREPKVKTKSPDDWVRRLSRALSSFRRGLKT